MTRKQLHFAGIRNVKMTNPANSKKKEQLAQLKQNEFIFMNTSHVIIVFVMMNQGKYSTIEAITKRERKQCFC